MSAGNTVPIRYDLIDLLVTKINELDIPAEPPFPPVRLSSGSLEDSRIAIYLAEDILRHSIFLAEKCLEVSGKYLDGAEAPESCVAYSTSSIILSFTAFETFLNETININSKYNIKRGDLNLFKQAYMEQKLLTRFESLMRAFGVVIDWSREPYQSLKLLHTVRNSLVHHGEHDTASTATGYFPKKSLKSLAIRINSPYVDEEAPYHWYTHTLTPNGAAWALNTVLEIFSLIKIELDREMGTVNG